MCEKDDELDEETAWNLKALNASYVFALACLEQRKNNPSQKDVLTYILNDLVTELWDMGFSQSEVKVAFSDAVVNLRRYAAGEDRRGDHGGP